MNKKRFRMIDRLRNEGFAELWRDPVNGQLYTRHHAFTVLKSRANIKQKSAMDSLLDAFGKHIDRGAERMTDNELRESERKFNDAAERAVPSIGPIKLDRNRLGHIFIDQEDPYSPFGKRVILTPEQVQEVVKFAVPEDKGGQDFKAWYLEADEKSDLDPAKLSEYRMDACQQSWEEATRRAASQVQEIDEQDSRITWLEFELAEADQNFGGWFAREASFKAEIDRLSGELREREGALKFAATVLKAFWGDGDVGSLEGCDLQDFAEESGLLRYEKDSDLYYFTEAADSLLAIPGEGK